MINIRLTVEYNGAGFHGWQYQPGLRTIQGELHSVLELVLRQPIKCLYAAGRTDAGVHAWGQVVSFVVDEVPDLWRLTHSVSHLLKGEVSIVEAIVVPDQFNALHSPHYKQYSYQILNRSAPPTLQAGRVWHVGRPLMIERMQQEAQALIGRHDFSSFQGAKCGSRSTIKEIYEAEVCQDGESIIVRIVGSGFLKQMVRIIVGTLVEIGLGSGRGDSLVEIIDAKTRSAAGRTAPSWGLTLDWVQYFDCKGFTVVDSRYGDRFSDSAK